MPMSSDEEQLNYCSIVRLWEEAIKNRNSTLGDGLRDIQVDHEHRHL
jgi:hypothetical protein